MCCCEYLLSYLSYLIHENFKDFLNKMTINKCSFQKYPCRPFMPEDSFDSDNL